MIITLRTVIRAVADYSEQFAIIAYVAVLIFVSEIFSLRQEKIYERTVAALQAAECRLTERDRSGGGVWDCGGVKVWHHRTILDAWQAATGDATP